MNKKNVYLSFNITLYSITVKYISLEKFISKYNIMYFIVNIFRVFEWLSLAIQIKIIAQVEQFKVGNIEYESSDINK